MQFDNIMRCDFEVEIGVKPQKMLALFNKEKITEDEVCQIISKGPFVWERTEKIIVMTPEQFENVFGK